MYFNSVLVLVVITLSVQDVKSITVWGRFANFTLLMERILAIGEGLVLHPDPDLGIGRRKAFADSIVLVVKKEGKNKHLLINETRNSKEYDKARKFMALRMDPKEKANAKLVRTQHDRKVHEIMDFIDDHYLATNYFYNEVQRIKLQRKLKDDLRRMVEYLEKPEEAKMKEEVLQCYYDKRKTEKLAQHDYYRDRPNNLVINVLKDPYNDGFIN